MSGQHTPGPWAYEQVDGDWSILYNLNGQTPLALATVFDHACEFAEADARLIAAAPDLLALLVEAGEFIQSFNKAQHLSDRIEAAIDKALGK